MNTKDKRTGFIARWQDGPHWNAHIDEGKHRSFLDFEDARNWLLRYVYARNIRY